MYEIAIVEAGNCVYCGMHIDDGDHIFLCKECRRKERKGGKLMYDELVKNLRDLSNWSDIAWREYAESGKQLINQAADAIEALSKPNWMPLSDSHKEAKDD